MSQAIALLDHVIRPVSRALGDPHPVVEEILLSAATLRDFDPFSRGDDAGLGVFGISPGLHRRVWDEYLAFQPDRASQVRGFASQHEFLTNPDAELVTNTRYAAAIGISALEWVKPSWPLPEDVDGLTRLWSELTLVEEETYLTRLHNTLERLCRSASQPHYAL
ncbi:hypothetical protein EZI54_02305 [Marinobacter halodurans]|uniref:Uncharacterized protein n=1 Tax=Marinobacter halodurans TaxID=2528979 RepID=A0ABY1ZS98_9GAMM|nr:hypothetical protein [Marinobacter halodurans]TBW59164.1 hypothetical protein EZI54_02305 [Marinobacter halodurans]